MNLATASHGFEHGLVKRVVRKRFQRKKPARSELAAFEGFKARSRRQCCGAAPLTDVAKKCHEKRSIGAQGNPGLTRVGYDEELQFRRSVCRLRGACRWLLV